MEKPIENANIDVKLNKDVSKTEKKQKKSNPGQFGNTVKCTLFILN